MGSASRNPASTFAEITQPYQAVSLNPNSAHRMQFHQSANVELVDTTPLTPDFCKKGDY
jgi:hypothetical protein